jgi:ADP-heptose:LPS heptosyltransferase
MKILVIRFGAIGDLVLVEPVMRLLRNSGHEVHLLTKPRYAEPFVEHESLTAVHSWEGLAQLRSQGFDAILDAHNNLRSRWISFLLWPATVYRMPKEAWKKLPLPARFKQVRTVKERLLSTARPLLATEAVVVDNPWPGITQVIKPNPYRVLVLGATYSTKQIPSDMAVSLMNQLGGHWVLLGSQEDQAKAIEIARDLRPHVHAEISCAQGLSESAGILAGAKQVVSGDTGMAHWAAALHTPLHVIWGNTSPQYGLAPGQWGGAFVRHHQVEGLSCRPCSKFGFTNCPKGHFRCMRDQNLDSIAEAIKNLD